jgi:predicted  nucleic acid-binding Zn-ribbon protein
MSDQDLTTKYELEKLNAKIDANKDEIKVLREALDKLNKERDSAVKTAIVILGAAVTAMGGWIFNLISGHPK